MAGSRATVANSTGFLVVASSTVPVRRPVPLGASGTTSGLGAAAAGAVLVEDGAAVWAKVWVRLPTAASNPSVSMKGFMMKNGTECRKKGSIVSGVSRLKVEVRGFNQPKRLRSHLS